MRRAITLGWGLGAALSLLMGANCNPVSDLPCADDQTCLDQGEGGRCEAEGFCTFPDEACMLGRRWHSRAPDSLASTCWDPSAAGTDGGTDTDDSTTTSDDDSTSSGDDSTTSTSTTSTTSSTSTTSTSGDDATGSAMTCDEQYGAAADYMLCTEEAGSCRFNATVMMAASCDDVCEMFGGMCIAAELNDTDACTATAATTCDDATFNDGICTCDRM